MAINTSGNVGPAYTRPDLQSALPYYELIADCLGGSLQIKSRAEYYLPKPNVSDSSDENTTRYTDSYLKRAIFYNVTGRTLAGLTGQVFAHPTMIQVPDELEEFVEDAGGTGVRLIQTIKQAVETVIAYGRGGLWVDYSSQMMDGDKARPYLWFFRPENIINWRVIVEGGRKKLSLVVLRAQLEDTTDPYELRYRTYYYVLRLVNGIYTVEVYEGARQSGIQTGAGGLDGRRRLTSLDAGQSLYRRGGVDFYTTRSDGVNLVRRVTPTDANGMPFKEIVFQFMGAENNSPDIDFPPLYDQAELNIGHYRNSADYEETSFIAGQPTPVVSGLNGEWIERHMHGKVFLGSRAAVLLPVGGQMELVQAQPNTVPFEAMQHKERQMVAMGAKLIEQKNVQRTAREADYEVTTERSVLTSVVENVSEAVTQVLMWVADFQGASRDEIKFELNRDFEVKNFLPEDFAQMLVAQEHGVLSRTELRSYARDGGVQLEEDEEAMREIDMDMDKKLEREADLAKASRPPQQPGGSSNGGSRSTNR